MGLAHAADAAPALLFDATWSSSCSAVHMVGSVFNTNDSGSERDTESEDRDQRRRRLATLSKRRQRSKNDDNDRKRIRHTETQQASQRILRAQVKNITGLGLFLSGSFMYLVR